VQPRRHSNSIIEKGTVGHAMLHALLVLSRVFRGKFVASLKQAFQKAD
jgi:hypothetical protein